MTAAAGGIAPQSRGELRVLVVHQQDAGDVVRPCLTPAVRVGDVLVLPLGPDEIPQVRPPGVRARLLDRHYYVYRQDGPARRRACEQALFDVIADDYDWEVAEEANRDTIGRLLRIVAAYAAGSAPLRVLDFGCGTGLAATVVDPDAFDLVGTDASARMLDRASLRGMRTLPLLELRSMGAGWADGVIASFVLHLAVPAADLAAAAGTLGRGGVFAANFHKGEGRTAAASALAEHGLLPLRCAGDGVSAWQKP